MTIDELIKDLTEAKEKHGGNIDVASLYENHRGEFIVSDWVGSYYGVVTGPTRNMQDKTVFILDVGSVHKIFSDEDDIFIDRINLS